MGKENTPGLLRPGVSGVWEIGSCQWRSNWFSLAGSCGGLPHTVWLERPGSVELPRYFIPCSGGCVGFSGVVARLQGCCSKGIVFLGVFGSRGRGCWFNRRLVVGFGGAVARPVRSSPGPELRRTRWSCPARPSRSACLFSPGGDDHPALAVGTDGRELVFPFPAVHEGPQAAVSFGQQSPGAGWA